MKKELGEDSAILNYVLTTCELAKRWKCQPVIVQKLRRDGLLPSITFNRRTFRFRIKDVEELEQKYMLDCMSLRNGKGRKSHA